MMNKTRIRALQIGNMLFYLAMITMNIWAVTKPLNGVTTQEATNNHPHIFIPATWAFSIWTVLYILLGLFVAFQNGWIGKGDVAPNQADVPTSSNPDSDRVAPTRGERWAGKLDVLFMLSCLLNILWLNAWHHLQYTLSTGIIIAYVLVLVVLYVRIHNMPQALRQRDRWWVLVPFSLLLGWVSVATISNVASMLQSLRWDAMGLHQEFWGGFACILALALGLFFKFRFNNLFFAAAVIWGLAAVAARQWQDTDREGVTITAIMALASALLLLIALFVKVRIHPIHLPDNTQGRTPNPAH